jgi:predicted O-linked N-acetylglucosamine transferase (SPINDLY family)
MNTQSMAMGGKKAERLQRALKKAVAQVIEGKLGPVDPQTARRLMLGTVGDAFHALSVLANNNGHAASALEFADCALASDAACPEFHIARGRALKPLQRLDDAASSYRSALRLRPSSAEAWVSLGIVLRLQGRLDEAADCQRKALAIRPDFPEALINLANVLVSRVTNMVGNSMTAEELREAEKILRRVVGLAPTHVDAMHNLGLVLKLTGRYHEAAEWFNRALGQASGRVDSCVEFAELLQRELRPDLARDLLARWLGHHGSHPAVEILLSECHAALGETEDALRVLDGVAAANAQQSGVKERLRKAIVETKRGRDMKSMRALYWYRAAVDARPEYMEVVCSYLLSMCYEEEDPAALLSEHQRRIAPALSVVPTNDLPPLLPLPAEGRRLRIGYLSFDFKSHSVAFFLESLFERHDRERFEVHAYKTNAVGDAMTERLKSLADHWVECIGLSDAEIAQKIRADGIDILVDLCGHTNGSRMGVLQRRPASCQVEYLGYPATTGARCFDFRFTDWVIDGAGDEQYNSEALLRLPQSMFCYRPVPMPEVAALPSIERGYVTFGSFNNLSKVSDATLRMWVDVLHAVPDSRLLLKSQQLTLHGNRQYLIRHFADAGIAEERLLLNSFNPDPQGHLSTYHQVDIGVDTYPYSGATTTCEALCMGVPVVTRVGRTQPSRMSASILGAVGLHDLITQDSEKYVQRVVELASDVSRLAELRAGLRSRVLSSRLSDSAGFARDFEVLLSRAFEAVLARTSEPATA